VTVRTRYAPSPTGDPHVGNLRTALFSWALARANGGQFVLRIEDTDRKRLVPSSLEAIYWSLRWLGLEWDEGPDRGGPYGPYVQSQKLDRYRQAAEDLIARGRAYRCFCTPERLDRIRAEQAARGQPPGYDGHCRSIPPAEAAERGRAEPHVVRFRMKDEGVTVIDDPVRGQITFENALQDDFVALKSDGFPTYHFGVVIDDHDMEITHALRGDEWISSAPKHVQLYEALDWPSPLYVHLPLILGPDRKKLSKRTGDTALREYADHGYLPDAMVNFLALLGWSLDDKTTIIPPETLARSFSLERVVPNPAVFDIAKLDFLNGHYIRELPEDRWLDLVAEWCDRGLPASVPRPVDREVIAGAAPLLKERVTRLEEVPGLVEFLFGFEAPEYPPEALSERLGGDREAALRVLDEALLALDAVPESRWQRDDVEAAVRGLEERLGMKLRKFVPALYVAEMGRARGIPLFDSLVLLGRERALQRLRTARARLEHQR
jgi:glutamyl-tRNA synthetase